MLKKILIASATLVGLLLAIGLVLPSKFRVERSTTLQAPPEAVYPYVANLERWREWGPWSAEKYPGSQWTFGGPELGVGAVHSWSGGSVGNGTLSLTEADPKTGVAYDMSVEHGRYLVHGRISFAPEGQGTRVTWVDEGDIGGNPLAHYLVPLIRSRLGGYLEEGLAGLAKRVESGSAARPEPAPAPVPVEQAEAPASPSAPVSATPPTEDSPVAAPSAEGSPVAVPPVEAAQVPEAGEVAPPVVGTPALEGEAAPASQDAGVPSSVPAPVEASPTVPASTPAPSSVPSPAPTEGQAASPT